MEDTRKFQQECCALIDRFCGKFMQHRPLAPKAKRMVKMLAGSGEPLRGEPGGWAGGIIHAMTCHGCGVPGVLNASLEKSFGVTIGTIRKRAAQIGRLFEV
jgi:hypothetical protein